MLFRNTSPEDVISGGTRIVQAGLKGGKIVVTYGKPALEKSANLTAQVRIQLVCTEKTLISSVGIWQAASWGAQNPVLATCAVVSTTGAVVLAGPSLATVPILSSMGFIAGGIQAGMCNIAGEINKLSHVSRAQKLE